MERKLLEKLRYEFHLYTISLIMKEEKIMKQLLKYAKNSIKLDEEKEGKKRK